MGDFREYCRTDDDLKILLQKAQWYGECAVTLKERFSEVGFSFRLVKQNPKRTVLRLCCEDGEVFYLKLFTSCRFPVNIFFSYAYAEYNSAKALEKASLPVIDYAAWGKFSAGELCLSRALPESVDCRQYFFESVYGNTTLSIQLLAMLSDLICRMKKANFTHPDFHLGNILYSRSENGLFLPDPYGVKHKRPFQKDDRQMCHPFLELYSFVPQEALLEALCEAGLAQDADQAGVLLENALASFRKRREKEYDKLKKRILEGRSKFSTEVSFPDGGCCAFRHTYWYTPPERFVTDPAWRRVEIDSTSEAEKIWVDSFLSIPLPEPVSVPLAWERLPSGKNVFHYVK